jgi:ATPases involved in chromosome partitioning
MKIKLMLLDNDEIYLNRITSFFVNEYSEKLEVYSFTDINTALTTLKSARINTLISSCNFEIDTSLLPSNCELVYFAESADIKAYKGKPAVYKFQMVENIYKAILNIYSEYTSDLFTIGSVSSGSPVRVITFASVSGGVGTSTSAVACAKSLALTGKKVLYLNLEKFGSTIPFFHETGSTDFSDIIFALKSKKVNLSLKLESTAVQDSSGVFFYETSKTALDMMEINVEDIQYLITELKTTGLYDNVILDIDFSLDEVMLEIFKNSEIVVFVSDGSELSNVKFVRMYKALEIVDEALLLPRMQLFYNKFSNKSGKKMDLAVPVVGGAPKFEQATSEKIVSKLINLNVFQKL